jgi:hypothetical protein
MVQEQVRHRRGRAARVEGVARTSGVARGAAVESWRDAALRPRVAHLDGATRARLAAAWIEDARMEHASIAAFSKTSLELLALGAPAELLAAAHAAAGDEIQHALACFALASAYAGRDLGPAPFAEAARMAPLTALDRVALETLHDGCVGETIAAVEAREAARLAEDPAVRARLAQIAEDEARHAELAWQILAWTLRSGGAEVAAAVGGALADLEAELDTRPAALPDAGGEDDSLAQHGRLGAGARARLAEDVMAQVVLPCLRALLSGCGES